MEGSVSEEPALQSAIEAWVKDVADYIDAHRSDIEIGSYLGGWSASPRSEGTANILFAPLRGSIKWTPALSSALASLPSWRLAEAAINALLRSRPSVVSWEGSSAALATGRLALPFAEATYGRSLLVSVDRERISERVAELVTFLASEHWHSIRWVIPLSLEVEEIVEVEPGVHLKTLAPHDLAWALNLHLLRSRDSVGFVLAPTQYRYACLEVLHKGSDEGTAIEASGSALESALALSLDPPAAAVGYFSATRLPPPPSGSVSQAYSPRFLEPSLRNWRKAEVEQFVDSYRAIRRTTMPQSLRLALRRLARTAVRSAPEDKTIDLMIAAEAIYLSDSGGASQRGELSYRLSTRAGLWLDTNDATERLRVKRLFSLAYTARSIVAHGSTPSAKDLRSGGVEYTLEGLNDEVRRVLVDAGRKALEASARSAWPPKWDELLFLSS